MTGYESGMFKPGDKAKDGSTFLGETGDGSPLWAEPVPKPAVPDVTNDPAYEELAHWTHRMLQALDAYWLHCDGLPPRKWNTVRSESTGEDWWIRFEKYRARVELMIRAGGAA